jgi:hypothetical protein
MLPGSLVQLTPVFDRAAWQSAGHLGASRTKGVRHHHCAESGGSCMEIRLDGEVAVVTGAASGIGRGVALAFAAAGASVIALDRAADRLATLARQIESSHGTVSVHQVDVSIPDQVEAAVADGQGQLGDPTVLVTAAGASTDRRGSPPACARKAGG